MASQSFTQCVQEVLTMLSIPTGAQNGLSMSGTFTELGGALYKPTTIATAGNDVLLDGTGRLFVGGNTIPASGNKLTVNVDGISPSQYAGIQVVNNTTGVNAPQFNFYTIAQANKIGYAGYLAGNGGSAFYAENQPSSNLGNAFRIEQRAGGSATLAGAETVVNPASVPNVPVGQDIAHYGNGYGQRVWAFATALDTNYNKYLGNQNWNTIYWLNQSVKSVPFHRFDNQVAYTHSMTQYVNANGAGASGSVIQIDNGSGNSSNGILINHNSAGRPLTIVHNTGTLRSGFEENGKFTINYGQAIDMSAQSYLNVGGSIQLPQKVVSANYTATDLDYHITVISATPVTITLPSASNSYRRIYVIKNSGTSTVTVTSTGFLTEGVTNFAMNVAGQSRIFQASYTNVAQTVTGWTVIGGFL